MESKQIWSFNYSNRLYENKLNIINCSKHNIIPTHIKETFELLFNKQLIFSVKFNVNFVNNKYILNNYVIIIGYKNKLLAKANCYLKLIDENINIDDLRKNNHIHKLSFNFDNIRKTIYVNSKVSPTTETDEIIEKLKQIIKDYNFENKNKLYNAILLKTCEDVTNKIFSYISE